MTKSMILKIVGLALSFGGSIVLGVSTKLDNEANLKKFVDEHLNK